MCPVQFAGKAAEQDSTCNCAIEAKSQKVDLTTDTVLCQTNNNDENQQLKNENQRLRTRNAALEERLRKHEELYNKMHKVLREYAGIKGTHG